MAERELSILVRAKGAQQAAQQIGKADTAVGRLAATGRKTAANLTTAFKRIGIAVGVGVVAAVGMGIRSLADLQRTEAQTAAVIKSTGSAAGQTNASIRKHAQELENLSTVDDKVIQDGQNMLLTFTNIKGKVFPEATKATLNLAVAMAKGDASQVDMKASAIQVGKALNDPIKGITALRKVGVSFTKDQEKQIKALVKAGKVMDAQKLILKELNTEFGNAAEAAGTGPAAMWRRLQDVGEDLSQALARGLLPVLERAGKWLSTKLADPAVIAAIEDLGEGLANAASKAMDFVETIDFKAIGAGLQVAAGAAGAVVSAFMGMPEWVKIAVISGWGLNKLTGGAVTGLIGHLASGLIKGILNMNAGVVNINAGVVNGGGPPLPVPGSGGGNTLRNVASLAALVVKAAAPVIIAKETGAIDALMSGLNRLIFGEKVASDIDKWNQSLLSNGARPGAGSGSTSAEMFGPPTPRGGQNQGREQFGPPSPVFEDDPRLAGIIERAQKAGRQPLDLYAAAMATLTRNIIREASFFKGATAAPTADAQRTAFAIEHKADVPPPVFEDDPRLAAILKRAEEAGRKPKDPYAAAMKTLQANIARDQAAARATLELSRSQAMTTALAAHSDRENSTSRIVNAISGLRMPAPSVSISISAADNIRTQVQRSRIVKPHGPRGALSGPLEF